MLYSMLPNTAFCFDQWIVLFCNYRKAAWEKNLHVQELDVNQ